MCGIVGILSSRSPVNIAQLERATDAIAHRGPDGEGHWLSNDQTVGLGHRRLAITDAENGAQPLSNAEQTIWAVVNGEFYDDEAIRQQLVAMGYRFKTRSDSEIILHLYDAYGLDCLSQLRGEFAFILYDVRKQKLIAGRDRFGIKPLCYSEVNRTLYLASEAKALFAAGVPAAWDKDAMAHVSCFQYTAPHQTMFHQVQQLLPGHILIADDDGYRVQAYWDMDFPAQPLPAYEADFPEAMDRLHSALSDAVKMRLRTDTAKICCHLSGGIDSASIAALASAAMGKPIPCFTVGFGHAHYDESLIAQRFAETLGADFCVVDASATSMADALSDAVYYSEGLAINSHLAAKFLLNRSIAKHGFTIALSGEGSDELFAGYPHFKLDDEAAPASLFEENIVSAGVQIAHGDSLPVGQFRQALGYVPAFIRAKASIGLKLRSLMDAAFTEHYTAENIYRRLLENLPLAAQLSGREHIHQSTYLWCKFALANYILRTLGDGCEMAHSIEGRVPFLDHHLFAFARGLPSIWKIHDGIEKHILREAMKPYVSEEIIARRKHPFMAPPLGLLSDAKGAAFINDCLRSIAFKHMPFFNQQKVIAHLDALPGLSTAEHIATEPCLMLMVTSFLLAQRYGL